LELDSTFFPGCPRNHPEIPNQKRSPRKYPPGVSNPAMTYGHTATHFNRQLLHRQSCKRCKGGTTQAHANASPGGRAFPGPAGRSPVLVVNPRLSSVGNCHQATPTPQRTRPHAHPRTIPATKSLHAGPTCLPAGLISAIFKRKASCNPWMVACKVTWRGESPER